VMIKQNTPLNIQTIENFPMAFDLSISPVFDIFTATVQDPSTTDDEITFFHLKRDAYDGIMTFQVTMLVLCKYDPKGHHMNVAEATKCQPIISVARKLVTLKNRKTRNGELKKLAKKLDSPNKTTRKGKQPYSDSTQEESSSQAKRLRTAATNINKEADTDPGPENTVSETQNSATEQSLNDSQDDQSICEVISSDQEDEEMSENTYSP
ncbi:10300_t:CDS:2, partial [Racocetra persica]